MTRNIFILFIGLMLMIPPCFAQVTDVIVVTDRIPDEEDKPAGYTFYYGSEASPYSIGSGNYLNNIYLGYYGTGINGANGYAVQNGSTVSTPNLYVGERGTSAYIKKKGQYTLNSGSLTLSNLF